MKTIFRPLVVAYASLSVLLPAAALPWPVLLPACLSALLAVGTLWVRVLTGSPAESGVRPARAGLVVLAGLLTLPAVALLLHPFGVPVAPVPLIAGVALLATLLGVAGLLRIHRGRRDGWGERYDEPGVPAQRLAGAAPGRAESRAQGSVRTVAAVLVPVVLSLLVGTLAVRAVERGPHPALPGYLTVALDGWAAGIAHPLTVPARGVSVPVRVTSSGLPVSSQLLRLRVDGAVIASRRETVRPGMVYGLTVRVPAPPPDGCVRAVGVSVGAASTVFYVRSAARQGPRARGRGAC
ncbi:hypothetical protein [Actinoplanes regularis]|uniref:Uncharacterized protein n=1 Tax=Actinoplanes regularis TaxID=52697 RepID=A0A238USY9_9ACTN|nr:hypothetical protein [Actinoplanes regularis]GIE84472.1 hypothetical protein Are01nite_09520 [Actinoplanes regularis]SNR25041.1 hypothetical protein SAMN06264365_101106 [Actinoplanes regularis]